MLVFSIAVFSVLSIFMLYNIFLLIENTHYSAKYDPQISQPWGEAAFRHDWEACNKYKALAAEHIAGYYECNPIKLLKRWNRVYKID
jgi:hypothetical protein